MPLFQDSTRSEILVKEEGAYNATTAAASVASMRTQRFTKESLKPKNEMKRSQVITGTSARRPMRGTYRNWDGTLSSEFAGGEFDPYLAAVLGAAQPTDLVAGAFSARNAFGVTAEVFTSFLIQKRFRDIAKYHVLHGGGVDEVTLTLKPKEFGQIDVKFMGASAEQVNAAVSIGASVIDPIEFPAVRCGEDISGFLIGTTLGDLAAWTGSIAELKLVLKRNLRERPTLGSNTTRQHGRGEISATLTLKTYLDSAASAFIAQYINTPDDSFAARLEIDALPFLYQFDFPRLQVGDGETPISGLNTDVMADLVFESASYAGTELEEEEKLETPDNFEVGIFRDEI